MNFHKLISYAIAAIWLINGLFCKVLNLVPRHQEIVEVILNVENGRPLTFLIGILEIVMAAWIISGYNSRWNALIQMAIILTMNLLEFILAPKLLLWGKFNLFFAVLLVLLIYFNEFYLQKKPLRKP